MPIIAKGTTLKKLIAKATTCTKGIAKGVQVFPSELVVLNGATSSYGEPSVVKSDSGTSHVANLSSAGWRVQSDGRTAAALPNKVDFSGYSKIYFTVTDNTALQYVSLGYRSDEKTWINASGVSTETRKDLAYGETGTYSVSIEDDSGYIIVEIKNSGAGISSQMGTTISKIWLE